MRFSLVTAPTVEPLSLQDVSDHCQMGEIPEDQLSTVEGYITGARQLIERRLSRQLCTATWKLYLDEFPEIIEIRDKLPIKSLTHIKYYNTAGTLTTMTTAEYQTDFASDGRPARIMPAYGYTWPSIQTDRLNPIEIQFVSGYGTASSVPATIRNGMLQLVANWFENREANVIGTIVTQLPFGVEACITPEDWGFYG